MASTSSKPMATASFYGENRSHLTENSHPLPVTEPALPPYLSDPLLGPSKVWKIFRKQAEALSLIASLQLAGDLLPFSYESINCERLFLVAHPDVFWFRDCQKRPHLRNSYEIIASDAVSKLYFDLEFDRSLDGNRAADGNEMTRTLIRVVLYYVRKLFGVKYKMREVLVLDSSTERKFSVHLVFQCGLVFRTNVDAGHFVRFVCNEIDNIDRVCSDEEQLRFDIFKETTINIYAIKDLFVVNRKQARVLFCDLGVYTKNRLFRLYRNTKQGRQSPLVLSPINKFSPPNIDPTDSVQYERHIFLSSLVTYFQQPPDPALIKEFEKPLVNPVYSSEVNLRRLEKLHSGQVSPTKTSPYPELDNYIRTRVRPHGTIYRNVHFPTTNITVYDIKGFRYCGNIGRWHRSQNIKLIADVNRGVYYQKCHDVECADYKSAEWPLPPEVLFKIQSEADDVFEGVALEELLGDTGRTEPVEPYTVGETGRLEPVKGDENETVMKETGKHLEPVKEPHSVEEENEMVERANDLHSMKQENRDELSKREDKLSSREEGETANEPLSVGESSKIALSNCEDKVSNSRDNIKSATLGCVEDEITISLETIKTTLNNAIEKEQVSETGCIQKEIQEENSTRKKLAAEPHSIVEESTSESSSIPIVHSASSTPIVHSTFSTPIVHSTSSIPIMHSTSSTPIVQSIDEKRIKTKSKDSGENAIEISNKTCVIQRKFDLKTGPKCDLAESNTRTRSCGDSAMEVSDTTCVIKRKFDSKTEPKCDLVESSTRTKSCGDSAMEVSDTTCVINLENVVKSESKCDKVESSSKTKSPDPFKSEFQTSNDSNATNDCVGSKRHGQSFASNIRSNETERRTEHAPHNGCKGPVTLGASFTLSRENGSDRKQLTIDNKSEENSSHKRCSHAQENTNSLKKVLHSNAPKNVLDSNSQKNVLDFNAQKSVLDSNTQKNMLDSSTQKKVHDSNAQRKVYDINAEKSVLDSNSQKNVRDFNTRHCETKIVPDSIDKESDREMVLDYVRSRERKLVLDSGQKISRRVLHPVPPCEPVVKKIKF